MAFYGESEEFLPDKFLAEGTQSMLGNLKRENLIEIAKHLGIGHTGTKNVLIDTITNKVWPEGSPSEAMKMKQLELEMLKIKIEADREAAQQKIEADREAAQRKIEADREAAQRDREAAQREMEAAQQQLEADREAAHRAEEAAQRTHEREMEKLAATLQHKGNRNKNEILPHDTKFVPKFSEKNPDTFFQSFEKVASQLEWPHELWAIIVQREFTGRAQEVFSSLSAEQSTSYETVKRTVLEAYELVPAAYQHKFRTAKINQNETYVEFSRKQDDFFSKWCRSLKVETYDQLRQLMLLEEFLNSIPRHVRNHLEDRKVTTTQQAACLADEYVLSHPPRPLHPPFRNDVPPKSDTPSGTRNSFRAPDNTKCDHCGKSGHQKKNCFRLHMCQTCQTMGHIEKFCPTTPGSVALTSRLKSYPKQIIDDSYMPFRSDGTIHVGNHVKKISILRDTGASQSLLKAGVLPEECRLPLKQTYVQGIGGEYLPCNLQEVFLQSGLVTGDVIVGLWDELPLEGVDLLLGNDLAGDKVLALPLPRVTDTPSMVGSSDPVRDEFPDVFQASAVTRAQAKHENQKNTQFPEDSGETSTEQFAFCDTFMGTLFDSTPTSPSTTPITGERIIRAQVEDAALASVRQEVAETVDLVDKGKGIFMENGVLMCKWRPPTCLGPLSKKRLDNMFLVTIMDVSLRFREAIPLRTIKTRTIMEALTGFLTRFGLPKELQTDRGSSFVLLVYVCKFRERLMEACAAACSILEASQTKIKKLCDTKTKVSNQPKTMSFGIINAPATFQRLMNQVTAKVPGCVVYVDNVVWYSCTWMEHVRQLESLFGDLSGAGLVVNLQKCDFRESHVENLGHVVRRGEVRPGTAKVKTVILMRFLAITMLLLTKGPVLASPKFDQPYSVAVDACARGIGAVLLQEDDAGVDRPIDYFSKKLNQHQRNYSTIDKEALAIVLSVQHFELFLTNGAGEITVYTDHNPLAYPDRMKLSSQRLYRWSLFFQPYPLQVVHVSGKKNVVADALSRV